MQGKMTSTNVTDSTAALRAELEIELKNKKRCTYQSYECTQLSLDGYKFCAKHILQDKNAPFKPCYFVYSANNRRCQLPALKGEKKDYGYCNEHALKAALSRNKKNSKFCPPNSAEVLLKSLSHYIKAPRKRTASSSTQYSDESDRITPDESADLKVTKSQDPYLDLDASTIFAERCNEVLDFCSESESDIEASTFSSVWHDAQGDSSENESIDSEQEDVLKHANVYTAEEITSITKDKLIRLQTLYVDQYRHLQYLLKERRRKYLHSLKREKETCCNIYNQVRDNPKEQRLYKKLKALNNYQKVHGVDAILTKRVKDIRSKASDTNVSKGPHSKCTFSEGGVKCGERAIPLARHCRKHILEDTGQVLFRACGKVNGDVECTTPVAAIFEDSMCQLHLEIPPLRSYSQLRKDSESDMDDSAEAHLQYPPQFAENIKNDFMTYDMPPEIPKMETLPSLLFEESSQSPMSNSIPQNSSIFGDTTDPGLLQNISNSEDMEMKVEDIREFKDPHLMPPCLNLEDIHMKSEKGSEIIVDPNSAAEEPNPEVNFTHLPESETSFCQITQSKASSSIDVPELAQIYESQENGTEIPESELKSVQESVCESSSVKFFESESNSIKGSQFDQGSVACITESNQSPLQVPDSFQMSVKISASEPTSVQVPESEHLSMASTESGTINDCKYEQSLISVTNESTGEIPDTEYSTIQAPESEPSSNQLPELQTVTGPSTIQVPNSELNLIQFPESASNLILVSESKLSIKEVPKCKPNMVQSNDHSSADSLPSIAFDVSHSEESVSHVSEPALDITTHMNVGDAQSNDSVTNITECSLVRENLCSLDIEAKNLNISNNVTGENGEFIERDNLEVVDTPASNEKPMGP